MIREEEWQEIEKLAKENIAYRDRNIEGSYAPPNDLEEDCLELIAEVRRLKEELRIHVQENKSLAVNNDLVRKDRDNISRTADFKTNQRYKQALEDALVIACKDEADRVEEVLREALKGEG